MKQKIESLLHDALQSLLASGDIPAMPAVIQIDATKDKKFGDYATNVAMVLAKPAKKNPRALAEQIVQALPESAHVDKAEIAGPGFINIFLSQEALYEIVPTILKLKDKFGHSKMGQAKKVLVEFVSSNPTGPLHVGHGRHAAFGAVIANLLDTVGFKVTREYYVNDAGRQMDILAVSIWMRYLALAGEQVAFPANGYQGDYVTDIARKLFDEHADKFKVPANQVMEDLPPDEPEGGDKEKYIDALTVRAKEALGIHYQVIFDAGLDNIVSDISDDLAEFGVQFDSWFSERSCVAKGDVDRILEQFKANGHVYEREGALWFRSTDFGDEKDRVLVRSNGTRTYFANDVAYHLNKFERGFDIAIDVFGADHHGYAGRMKAAMEAAGINPERLLYLWVQFVSLYRGGEQVAMSTRGGQFVTLRELRSEVGNDVARFFYVMRKSEQHIDFDLDLAKAESNENPVYYLQYAYARICSVNNQLKEKKIKHDLKNGLKHLGQLTEKEEREMLNTLAQYPGTIVNAALNYEPHVLTNYLRDLVADFHSYYNAHHFIVDDIDLRDARLTLVAAIKQVLANGFHLLGISAPESM